MDSPASKFKNRLYSELARLSKGFASNKRLEILNLLTQAPKTVEKIAQETGMSIANTSRHLQVLKDSHLVKTSRDGNHIIYRLASPKINQLIRLLITVGEEELTAITDVRQNADRELGVKVISLTEAMQQAQESLLLDVRPQDEFQVGHVDGAINIPLDHLTTQLDRLPKDQQIIVYCRGQFCPNANLATRQLNQHGYNAVSLNHGVQDWRERYTTNIYG